MTKQDKLLKRLQSNPKDFSWDELVNVLNSLGFETKSMGKTFGSRRKFENKTHVIISLHEPHNPKIVKSYVIKQVLEILKTEGLI